MPTYVPMCQKRGDNSYAPMSTYVPMCQKRGDKSYAPMPTYVPMCQKRGDNSYAPMCQKKSKYIPNITTLCYPIKL